MSSTHARPEIAGLFEIHITVDDMAKGALYGMRKFCADHKYKPIHAISSTKSSQLMFSKYKNGTESEVVARAEELATQMCNSYGLTVTRVKVEAAMGSENVPQNPSEREDGYFEWHLKFDAAHAADIESFSASDARTFCSYNHLKRDLIPMLTIRVPASAGRVAATKIKDEIMSTLKSKGIRSNEGIAAEFAVYDTNVGLDFV